MTTTEDEKKVIEYLEKCTKKDLRYILQQVFKTRSIKTEHEERSFFLGEAFKDFLNEPGEPKWEFAAVAYVDTDQYAEGTRGLEGDYIFFQHGKCDTCGIWVVSDLKGGICPVCGSKVALT